MREEDERGTHVGQPGLLGSDDGLGLLRVDGIAGPVHRKEDPLPVELADAEREAAVRERGDAHLVPRGGEREQHRQVAGEAREGRHHGEPGPEHPLGEALRLLDNPPDVLRPAVPCGMVSPPQVAGQRFPHRRREPVLRRNQVEPFVPHPLVLPDQLHDDRLCHSSTFILSVPGCTSSAARSRPSMRISEASASSRWRRRRCPAPASPASPASGSGRARDMRSRRKARSRSC
jgi:hypothetical protein